MPAPGRMDGHMSKASRDLSKGIAVKSNGFKYGGGKDEGWGTGGEKGRRVGKGGGRRDVAARARLREILERKRAAAEAGDEAGKTVGNKRKRGGGGGGDDRDAGNKAPRREEPKPAAVEPTEETPNGENEHGTMDNTTTEGPERWTCATCGGVKCGNAANYQSHVLSKKHKAAAQRERGRATLAAMKAARAEAAAARG